MHFNNYSYISKEMVGKCVQAVNLRWLHLLTVEILWPHYQIKPGYATD